MIETKPITFAGTLGQPLAGLLSLPDAKPRGFAVFAHCFTCGKDSHAAARISRALAERGIGVLRFDVTGLGESGGDFAETTFSCDVSDLSLAADYLRDQWSAPAVLIGHSLGGAAVLAAAASIPEVAAVVTIGAPSDPAHVVDLFAEAVPLIMTEGSAEVKLGRRTFRMQRSFVDDIREQPQLRRIAALDRALMVMHAPGDNTVGIDNARQIFETAKHPKSFVAIDGADHLLSNRRDSEFVSHMISAWVDRHITG